MPAGSLQWLMRLMMELVCCGKTGTVGGDNETERKCFPNYTKKRCKQLHFNSGIGPRVGTNRPYTVYSHMISLFLCDLAKPVDLQGNVIFADTDEGSEVVNTEQENEAATYGHTDEFRTIFVTLVLSLK